MMQAKENSGGATDSDNERVTGVGGDESGGSVQSKVLDAGASRAPLIRGGSDARR